MPWRSITTSADQTIVIDFGTIFPWDLTRPHRVVLIGANFLSCIVQAHSADSWAAPDFTSGVVPIDIDPDWVRYRVWLPAPGDLQRRYMRIVIPTQATTDGANYFQLAGVWVGEFVNLPHGLSPGYEREVVAPRVELTAAMGQWTVAYESGDMFVRHRWDRSAEKNMASPGTAASADEWAIWRSFDRILVTGTNNGRFCYCVDNWGTTAAWVMRQMNTTNWKDDGLVVARDRWDLEECVAG